MHKPRQAIPEYSVNMHLIKEVAEAKLLGQAELLKGEHKEQAELY